MFCEYIHTLVYRILTWTWFESRVGWMFAIVVAGNDPNEVLLDFDSSHGVL